jgi:hypothetical protein
VSVTGQVRVERIGVRTSAWARSGTPGDPAETMTGSHPGVLPGLEPPRGYVVPTSCATPDEPVGEVVMVVTKSGDEGGRIRGLGITYESGSETDAFVAHAALVLCGTRTRDDRC